MEDCILLKNGLFLTQVCSVLTESATFEWVRTNNPAGTINNWGISSDRNHAPHQCDDYPERTHFMFLC